MLVGTNNGGIDHHVFVVVVARQSFENTVENPALRPPAEALMNDFPITETLRQITPRNAGSVAVENRFHEQPIVRRSAPHMTFAPGKKILDPFPLIVA
jgi:hypothetical protein